MIQGNELRLNNLVYHIELCENVQVESISSDQLTLKDHVVWDGDIGLITGIPLTEEILLKCGFEEVKENDFIFNAFRLVLDPIGNYTNFYVDWVDDEDTSIMCWEVGYLHQLQNLYFALTQKELQINLHNQK